MASSLGKITSPRPRAAQPRRSPRPRPATLPGTGACRLPEPEPIEQVRHSGDVPATAAPRQHAAGVQLAGDRPKAFRAARPDVLDHRREVPRMALSVPGDGRSKRRSTFACPAQGRGAIWIAELHAPCLRHRQCLLRPLRDRLALLLGHQRHDADGRSFASGRSTAANFTPLSRSVSRKAALRDSRSSLAITKVAPVTFARCSALPKLRPVRVLPALDLGEAADQRGPPLRRERRRSPAAAPRCRARSRPAAQ